ncbi:hypothetical protein HispidOSU_021115, partial [Sigmodon hispidus]
MSTGDTVCTGWLVKSPPERKLQRYVSRGADSPLAFVSSVLCHGVAARGPWESLALGVPNVTVPSALAAGEANGRRKVKSHVELCCCCALQKAGLVVPLTHCVQPFYTATVSGGG